MELARNGEEGKVEKLERKRKEVEEKVSNEREERKVDKTKCKRRRDECEDSKEYNVEDKNVKEISKRKL